MCGIVGYVGPAKPSDFLIEGLRRLEYRGYDSAGVATISRRRPAGHQTRRPARQSGRSSWPSIPRRATIGIGHTRWATHGPATDVNAHPHLGGDRRRGDRPQRRDREFPPAQSSGWKAKAIASARPPTAKSSPT